MTDSVILEEKYDPHYEPTEDEILDYALWLGMDPGKRDWLSRHGGRASSLAGRGWRQRRVFVCLSASVKVCDCE